jgi:hypothetical protein
MSFDGFVTLGPNMSKDMVGEGNPYETLGVAIVSHLCRAFVLATTVLVLAVAPASASARPAPSLPAGHQTHGTSEKLELGATVLAGGSVALLVFGTIGLATIGERRRPAASR